MSGDKRSVSTDALDILGTIIQEDAVVGRDAIHLAVEPVIAGERLYPGQEIGFDTSGRAMSKTGGAMKLLGIVDPFLKSMVFPGDKIFLVVYPRQITSLRHVWSHPDFAEEPTKTEIVYVSPQKPVTALEESEKWMREFCDADSLNYHKVVAAAMDSNGEYLTIYDSDAHGNIPPEFWDHMEVITGRKFQKDERAEWFSCSC